MSGRAVLERAPALLWALAALTTGCAPALHGTGPALPGAPAGDPATDAAEVHALARRSALEPDGAARAGLARRAVAAGERCQAAAPGSPACDYALAIALGVQARERPSTLKDGLARMAVLLRRAAAADPALDQAGPDRVLALLLLRAPGWPLGPGDAEEGLAAARRAVDRAPEHPPNQLALAEALVANGDEPAGRAAASRALAQAEARSGDPEAPGWRREARKLLDGR